MILNWQFAHMDLKIQYFFYSISIENDKGIKIATNQLSCFTVYTNIGL